MLALSFSFILLGFLMFFRGFGKKLLCLLSLEILMIFIICMFLLSGLVSKFSVFSCMVIFLCFMVLDSVLGISLLIGASRASSISGSFIVMF